ncbi:isoprenyl transferase [Fulvivirga maritima]|uniref:isoprenyl transferase n=1 Tax=Fulvivirga maritima TaxID=2904247 RepID=UPI001F1A01D5|nr:isoprenyl transferase [Fulvivirga maritima]UII27869.1 isoprenyl transferase [Fulvivirga maritima]
MPNENIVKELLPKHIAIIMDGNGRWAKNKGAARIFGHRNAITAVREATEGCAELGVEYLTLYAFSTENWGRPPEEVLGLMELLVATIKKELKTLHKNNVRLTTIGDTDALPKRCRKQLLEAIADTKDNTGLTLVLALSYSGRWEILQAVKRLANDVKDDQLNIEDINDENFAAYLNTAKMPDPELLIRTSGEMRISNFLLWQLAYTEIYFTPKLWPDFRREDLHEAIISYQKRERRFGRISEQVNT